MCIEKGWLCKIVDEDLLVLLVFYCIVVLSLLIVCEILFDVVILVYFEGFVQCVWFQVYGFCVLLGGWFKCFLGGEWSWVVCGIWLDLLIVLVVMVVGIIVGWLFVVGDFEWYYVLVFVQFVDVCVLGVSCEVLVGMLFGNYGQFGLLVFVIYLFSNNVQVFILVFVFGFVFGIFLLLLLV